jgi:Flp pilus assembly protein TadG
MRSLTREFAADGGGNFAIMTAVLAVPLLFTAAYMIDVSTITRTKAELQQALDAAVLAVAREGKDVSEADANRIAAQFLGGNLDPEYTKLSVSKVGTEFTVKAQTTAQMAFGGLLGYSSWPINASSSADIAYASYEIALVLDQTGSMAGGKLASMKDAVLGLVDNMSAQVSDKDKLKFAMVPFNNFVNVGAQYGPSFDKKGKQVAGTGAPWLDLKGATEIPQSELDVGASRFQLYANMGVTWPGCVETRYLSGTDYDIDDTAPDAASPSTLFVPAFSIDEPDTAAYGNSYIKSNARPNDNSVAEKKKRWAKYGVKTDLLGKPLNGGLLDPLLAGLGLVDDPGTKLKKVKIDSGVSKLNGLPKGPGNGCDVQPLTPLTNDYKGIKDKVNALKAAGTTNIKEGVAWGHRLLSPDAPFSDSGAGKTANLERIMIVLTDGANVFGNAPNDLGSRYSSDGYLVDGRIGIESGGASATNALMNARTLAACTAAKQAGIEIYTIRLEEPDVATGTMLKECASAEDHYFDVPNRTQLDEAFAKIRNRIVRIRISS